MTDSLGPLFSYTPPAPSSPKQSPVDDARTLTAASPHATAWVPSGGNSAPPETQQQALDRVLSRQQQAVVAFLKAHVGKEFRGEDLRASCEQQLGKVAPDSPRRVMNELARRNVVAVRVVCQSKSLYFCEGA